MWYIGSTNFTSRDRSPDNLPEYNSYGILSSSSTPTQSLASGPSDSVSTHGESEIPTHWSLEVAECLAEKCLSDSACQEVVRALVNLLFTRAKNPTRLDCEYLARKLIMKYPFDKDDLGDGYVSFT